MPEFDAPPASSTADFGAANVRTEQKAQLVDAVFSQVAPYYDRMNDIMSAGLHRRWKNAAVCLGKLRPGMRVLDLACGSGDLAARIAPKIAPGGEIVLADANAAMLGVAKQRPPAAARFVRCSGESLPFAGESFDRVFIGFGLRNIARREKALAEMRRVLRPGGAVFVLEFAPPAAPFSRAKKCYLQTALPLLGKCFFGDEKNYRYLGESVLRFPPPAKLAGMMRAAGFARADFFNIAAGAVYLHRARRMA